MNIPVEFGREALTLELADDRLAGLVEPHAAAQLEDLGQAIERSLEQPLGSQPLADLLYKKDSALILTFDHSRPSPRALLLPILRQCDASDVKATVCIALGCRRPMTETELEAHLGADICMHRIIQHDGWTDGVHLDHGATSRGTPIRINRELAASGVVIGAGFVEPSHLCGFSGGKELIVPGVSHHTTVAANQRWLFHPDARIGVMYGNPVSDDADEVAAKAPLHWMTHAVLGPDDQPTHVFSGRPRRAHLAACRRARPIYEVETRRADVVVASPGGWPHDLDLMRAREALAPAADTVNPGGAIILVAQCPDGWGPEQAFREWICQRPPQQILDEAPSSAATAWGVHGAYLAARPAVEKGAAVILVTSPEMVATLNGSFVQGCTDLAEAMDLATAHTGPDAAVAVLRCARRLILS